MSYLIATSLLLLSRSPFLHPSLVLFPFSIQPSQNSNTCAGPWWLVRATPPNQRGAQRTPWLAPWSSSVVSLIWPTAPVAGPVLRIRPVVSPLTQFGPPSLRHLRHAQRSNRSCTTHSRFFLCSRLALTERGHRPRRAAFSHCLAPPPPLLSLLPSPLIQPRNSRSPTSLCRRTPGEVSAPTAVPCREKRRPCREKLRVG